MSDLELQVSIEEAIKDQQQREDAGRLRDIERRLKPLIASKLDWVQIYKLVKEVSDNQLYAPAYKNLTAWARNYCEKNGCVISRIWDAVSAGRFYDEWQKLHTDAPILYDLHVDPKKILLIRRITKWDNNRIADLMSQLLAGEIKRPVLEDEMRRLKNRAKLPAERTAKKPITGTTLSPTSHAPVFLPEKADGTSPTKKTLAPDTAQVCRHPESLASTVEIVWTSQDGGLLLLSADGKIRLFSARGESMVDTPENREIIINAAIRSDGCGESLHEGR